MTDIGDRALDGTEVGLAAGAAQARQDRSIRLAWAIATALLSRFAALAVQLIALPVVLAMLGTPRYAAFVSLQASFGWFGLLGLGLTIALPRFLSAAVVHGDKDEQRNLILTIVAMLTAAGALVTAVLLLLGVVVSPQRLLHLPGGLSEGEVTAGFTAGAVFISLRFIVSCIPAIRSGYQELYRVNLLTAFANLAIIGLVLYALPPQSPLWLQFSYMFGPIVAVLVLDFVLLIWRRPYLVRGGWRPSATLQKLLPVSLNAVLKQVSFFFMSSGATIAVAHLTSVTSIAAFGSVMSLMMLGATGFAALYQPLLAAMANAHSHGDKRWFLRAYLGGLVLTLAVTGIVAVACATAGPWLALQWLGRDLGITHIFITGMALYFLVWVLSDYHFNVLAAMAKLEGLGKIYVLEGVSALACGSLLAMQYGIEGMAVGLAGGTAIFSLLYLPLRAWAIIQRDGWTPG